MGRIVIRPLERRDRWALRYAFEHLSAQSRWQRFLGAKKELSEHELARLLDVDHWHHEALIAFASEPRTPIAIARYMRAPRFDEAEIAVAVTDRWQRRGVGRALLRELRMQAAAAGIRTFIASTRHDNRAALAVASELGRRRVVGAHDGLLDLRLEL